MAKYSRLSGRNFLEVLEKIKQQYVNGDFVMQAAYVESVDIMLDDMKNNDFFGTEGQLDPRGDNRD